MNKQNTILPYLKHQYIRNDTVVTILKKQATSRWRIDVNAGLVFILNIDTRSQFQEKRKVVRGEKGS